MKKSTVAKLVALTLAMPMGSLSAAEHPTAPSQTSGKPVTAEHPTAQGHEHPTAPAQTQVKPAAAPTQAIIQGEILDLVCFMDHGEKGAKHKACAEKCFKEGAPVGLLTADGMVYLVLEDHNGPIPYQSLKGMAAEQVKVRGRVSTKGGVQAIVVQSVEKVRA